MIRAATAFSLCHGSAAVLSPHPDFEPPVLDRYLHEVEGSLGEMRSRSEIRLYRFVLLSLFLVPMAACIHPQFIRTPVRLPMPLPWPPKTRSPPSMQWKNSTKPCRQNAFAVKRSRVPFP